MNAIRHVLFVDHVCHRTTKSFDFLANLLRCSFEVEVFYYDTHYHVQIPAHKVAWADVIVYLEFLPSRFRIAEPGKHCVFVPMYDNEWGSRWQWCRIADSRMAILSFCGRISEHARRCGIRNLLDVRFALPPSPAPGNARVAVLWDRGQVGINHVQRLFAPGDLDKLVVVRHSGDRKPLEPIPDKVREAYHVELHDGDYLPEKEYRALLSEPGIYIAPRFTEGIGMSFLEALAAGKIVVAHNNATMNEAIEDGVNGSLVDMKNPPRINLPTTAPAVRLRKAEERHAEWKVDESRILNFFAAQSELPPCKNMWTIQSIVNFVRFFFEGALMRCHHLSATNTSMMAVGNGISGHAVFWPYLATIGKHVTIVGSESSHNPVRFLPRLVASQLAKYRSLAAIQADEVLDRLLSFLASP